MIVWSLLKMRINHSGQIMIRSHTIPVYGTAIVIMTRTAFFTLSGRSAP